MLLILEFTILGNYVMMFRVLLFSSEAHNNIYINKKQNDCLESGWNVRVCTKEGHLAF